MPAARAEVEELENYAHANGFYAAHLQPWDFSYYSKKLKKEKYAISDDDLRPYFELESVKKGVFGLAEKLYGIKFKENKNIQVYNPEVTAYEVFDEKGKFLAVYYADFHPRDGKRGGAWMNDFLPQFMDGKKDHRPHIVNVMNFTRATETKPALLTYDEVETFLHEFGHGLHGMLTRCHYSSQSGTAVPRDFVELPSQFMENYAYEPEVLKTYAFHYQTGEVIPDSLIAKINAAGKFNQGFVTTELLSASILDMDFHELTTAEGLDVNAFEKASMEKMGMIPEIIVRYRPTFYNHIFTTGYEAGYYSYTWAAVLDADAFAAFKETGNLFDADTAARFRHLLEQGGTRDAQELYLEFRGKEANPQHLLRRNGFIE
jgi:peptidyl-dipeptidase Dcp